jgi:S-adenosylmethionine-dependent methyltransferase
MADRYFNEMGAHFARKIYASPKGAIRLAVLTRDLAHQFSQLAEPDASLEVVDVGGGLGHMSEWLALRGHRVTLAEPSADMLYAARERLEPLSTSYPVQFTQASLQELSAGKRQFDLVVCHAVLEWLADPGAAIGELQQLMKPDAALSLAFYNRDALIYKNLIKGQFRKLDRGHLAGEGGRSLTPQSPLDPREVMQWVEGAGLECSGRTGIRVFHDYMPEPFKSDAVLEEVVAQELAYSTHPAFLHLGRYQHWWLTHRQR